MKKPLLFYRLASIGYIVLGIIHILVEFFDTTDNSAPVFQSMEAFIPSAFKKSGTSLFDFYKGYSIMMGFLAFSFGVQALLISKEPERRRLLITTALSCGASLVALGYFPALVYGFIITCTICYGFSWWMAKKA